MTETEAPATGRPAILHLRRAAVRAQNGEGARGLVSLILEAGSSHVLAGQAGSGKSAILEMIAMARPPARGGVELFGQDLAAVKPAERYRLRRRIGMIYQDGRLIDDLSVHDNIAIAVRAAGEEPRARAQDIAATLGWVGLGRRIDAMAGDLNPEGRRRLAMARAVINRPDLVIADEPSSEGEETLLGLLADLNAAGTAVLMATRDADLASRAGAEITWLTPPPQPPSSRPDSPEPGWAP